MKKGKKMNIIDGLTADDVLLMPKYSDISSRSGVDLSVDFGKGIVLKNPIVAANMMNVCGAEMAIAISDLGGMAILHRFMEYEEIPKLFKSLTEQDSWRAGHIGCSVGVHEKDKKLVSDCVAAGCKIICVDIAHGHSKVGVDMTRWIHENYPDALLISGNIATADSAEALYASGADVVKCGIGSGSICTTRIETGNGVAQLTALEMAFKNSLSCEKDDQGNILKVKRKYKVIADGGIRRAGDAVKYLCFSDAVMLGNVLAGTNEAPGETFVMDGVTYKKYAGSSTHKSNHVEGVVGLVPSKGPVKDVCRHFLEGISSGCSYQGVNNLTDLKKNPVFIRISNAGLTESHAHDIKLIK